MKKNIKPNQLKKHPQIIVHVTFVDGSVLNVKTTKANLTPLREQLLRRDGSITADNGRVFSLRNMVHFEINGNH